MPLYYTPLVPFLMRYYTKRRLERPCLFSSRSLSLPLWHYKQPASLGVRSSVGWMWKWGVVGEGWWVGGRMWGERFLRRRTSNPLVMPLDTAKHAEASNCERCTVTEYICALIQDDVKTASQAPLSIWGQERQEKK